MPALYFSFKFTNGTVGISNIEMGIFFPGPVRASKLEARMKQKQQQQAQSSDGWGDDAGSGWDAAG